MRKIRDIIPGPIPEGDPPDGEVLLKPSRAVWFFKKHIAVVGVMARAWKASLGECNRIMRSDDRGLPKKLERIRAELVTASARETYNPRTLYAGGFRRANCQCSPGCGHLS